MAGGSFETRYASFMDNMLKSAVAETTKLYESTVEELRAEISRITKENEALKSKYAETPKRSPRGSEEGVAEPRAPEKCDTGIQCDLVSLQMHLEDHCYYEQTTSSVQNLEQRGGHEPMENLQMDLSYELSAEGNHQEELLQPVVVHKQVLTNSPATVGEGSSCVQHPSINQTTSCDVTKSPTTEYTQVGLRTICTGEDDGRSCKREARCDGSKLMYQPVIILHSLKDNMKGNHVEQTPKIPEKPATAEMKAQHKTVIEEVQSVVTEEQSVKFLNEQNPSAEVEEPLTAAEMSVVQSSNEEQSSVVTQKMLKEQLNVAKQPTVHASLMPEKLEVASAEIDVRSLTDPPPRRGRGRPPKKNKFRGSWQQTVNTNEQLPSDDFPAVHSRVHPPLVGVRENTASAVTQQTQNENREMVKEQLNVAKQPPGNASLMPDKLSVATPIPKAFEDLEVASAEIDIGFLTDPPARRGRGRPPKKNKFQGSWQQPIDASEPLACDDFPDPPLIGEGETTTSEGISVQPHDYSPGSSSQTASLVPSHQEAYSSTTHTPVHQGTLCSPTLSGKQISCTVVHGPSSPKVRQKDYTVFIPKTKTGGMATGATEIRVQSQLQRPDNSSLRVVTGTLPMSTASPSQEQHTAAPQKIVLRPVQLEPHPKDLLTPQQSGGSGKLNEHNTVTRETSVAGHTLSNFESASPGFRQSNFSPKVTSIVQNTRGAVVKLTKLWLPPLEVGQPAKGSTSAAEASYNLNGSLVIQRGQTSVSHTIQDSLAAGGKSPVSPPRNAKGAELLSSTSASSTSLNKLKVTPTSKTTQALVLANLSNYLTKTNGTREKSSAIETPRLGFSASAEQRATDSVTYTLSDQTLLTLSESEESDVECGPMDLSAAMPEVQEKPSTSFTLTEPPGTFSSGSSAASETSPPATDSDVSLNSTPTSESEEAQEHSVLPKERSAPPIRLTDVFNDSCSPHSQMTKALFLAQLAMLPVCTEKVKISSSAVGTKDKDGIKKRLRSDLKSHGPTSSLLATVPKLNAEFESAHCHKQPRLAEDGVSPGPGRYDAWSSQPENADEPTSSPEMPGVIEYAASSKSAPSECTSDSAKEYTLTRDTTILENVTNVSVASKRPRSTKKGSDKNTNKPCLVSRRTPRITKNDNGPQQKTSKPAVRPRRSSITNSAARNKPPSEATPVTLRAVSEKGATTSEHSAASSRNTKSANSGTGFKKGTAEPPAVSCGASKSVKKANDKKTSSVPTLSTRGSKSGSDCRSQKRTQVSAVSRSVSTLENKANTPKKTTRKPAFSRKLFKDDTGQKACNNQTLPSSSWSSWSGFAGSVCSPEQPAMPERSSLDESPSTSRDSTEWGNSPRAAKVLANSNLKEPVFNEVAKPQKRPFGDKSLKLSKLQVPVTLDIACTPQRIYPPSIASPPILGRGPPIVSPLQPLSVIGSHLLKNQCGECGCILVNAATLKLHVSSHAGEQPFSCKVCGKLFPDSKLLNRHRRVHQNGRIHKCPICDKGFVYRFGVTQHILLVHKKAKPFVCPFCNKNFFTKAEGDAHVRSHTGERPFHCTLCDKKFKRRVALNVHLRWHNGEKRYWCSYCAKGFLDKNNLKFHLYTHTGERPYCCNICDKRFVQTSHLKKHLRNVHMQLDV